MKKTTISVVLAATICSSYTLANNDIEVITTTANRTTVPLKTSLSSQIVITQDDIEQLNPISISDLLLSYAAIDVSATGGRGQNASLFLRGGNAGHTLVLIDGVRVSSATLGLTDIQKLSVSNIQRIEIVKGARASLWGSEAIGGVIQIFTKQTSTPKLSLTFGTDKFKSLAFEASIKHGDGQTSFLIDHQESDGFDVLTNVEPDNDGYSYRSFALNGYQNIDPKLTFNWLVNIDEGDNEYDSQWLGGSNASEHSNKLIQLGGTYKWEDNFSQFSVSDQKDDSRTFVQGSAIRSGERVISQRRQLSASNTTSLSEQASFTIGTDLQTESIGGDLSLLIDERDLSALFAQLLYAENKWFLETSARYDYIEQVDAETTHNVAIGYQLTPSIKLSALHGTGFKVPTFNDLYWPADAYSKGNEDLVSERSDNIELRYVQSFKNAELNISYFVNDISNLIQWMPDSNFVYQPENVANASITGIELGLNMSAWGLEHNLSASWTDAIDESNNQQLALRAKRKAGYIATYGDSDNISGSIELRHIGERQQLAWDGGVTKLDSHTVINFNIGYQLNSLVKLTMSLKDVFDKAQPTAVGYNVAGRQAYVGVQLSL